jgi:hypothetical protein
MDGRLAFTLQQAPKETQGCTSFSRSAALRISLENETGYAAWLDAVPTARRQGFHAKLMTTSALKKIYTELRSGSSEKYAIYFSTSPLPPITFRRLILALTSSQIYSTPPHQIYSA